MISLCDSTVVTYNGCNAILERFVQDLKLLETEGISIGGGMVLKGTLVQVSFDNLGGNTIFGFVQSFSAIYCCRVCLCSKKERHKCTVENTEILTTVDQHNKIIEIITSRSPDLFDSKGKLDVQKTFGVKKLLYTERFKLLLID